VLLLEDLGPSTIPPWNRSRVRTAARSYAEFHRATLGRRLPRWVADRPPWKGGIARSWDSIGRREEQRREFAALAGARAAEAQSWIETHLAALQRVSLGLATTSAPHALLHFDTRSDNIRLRGGELKIFDWPFACAGPPELDAAAFAQSIPCEGGPAPEYFLAAYAQRLPVRERIIASSVAALAGFFAERAWRPAPPGLPRVRSIQRRQLKSSLAWAARILALPEPSWLEAVPD
jgi:thiamine kinase-like enzyme